MPTARDYGLGDAEVVVVKAARRLGDRSTELAGLRLVSDTLASAEAATTVLDAAAQTERVKALADTIASQDGGRNPLDVPYAPPFLDDAANAYLSGHPVDGAAILARRAGAAIARAFNTISDLLLVAALLFFLNYTRTQ